MGEHVLSTRDLVLTQGAQKPDIEVGEGLTLIYTPRESASTMWAMTLAGRMKAKSGTIHLGDESASAKVLHREVALAGVPQLDGLERNVSLAAIVREQAVWASPWYKRVPTDIGRIDSFLHAASLMGLEVDTDNARRITAGSLGPYERFKLRVVLALMSRPQARLLVVDDIDQLRSMELRATVLGKLAELSHELPVLVMSANNDDAGCASAVIEGA